MCFGWFCGEMFWHVCISCIFALFANLLFVSCTFLWLCMRNISVWIFCVFFFHFSVCTFLCNVHLCLSAVMCAAKRRLLVGFPQDYCCPRFFTHRGFNQDYPSVSIPSLGGPPTCPNLIQTRHFKFFKIHSNISLSRYYSMFSQELSKSRCAPL